MGNHFVVNHLLKISSELTFCCFTKNRNIVVKREGIDAPITPTFLQLLPDVK